MIAENKTYSEKLRDPRWQKLRLEVFERDDWTCQRCFTAEKTLCVHHLYYVKGHEPWEYRLDELVTACEDCHEIETETVNTISGQLLKEIKKKLLFSDNLTELGAAFHYMEVPAARDPFVSALCALLQDKEKLKEILSEYLVPKKV